VQLAGKTGTAEAAHAAQGRWHSWFIAYGPYDTPDPKDKIVVVAMVEDTNPWEWWAPYATNIIFQGIFANQDYDQALDALHWRYLAPTKERVE
jgi:Cell division protein FtsI/penicillin-binding protein 2